MTTGQYPKRRETDKQAQRRVERLRTEENILAEIHKRREQGKPRTSLLADLFRWERE